MKIKIATIILIAILAITGYVNAAMTANLQSGENIASDGQFTVRLNIDTKVNAAQFTIKYDAEALEFVNVTGHGGGAINNKEAGTAIAAFVSTEYSDAPFIITFKALNENKKTKIELKEISFVVEDTSNEYGVKQEDLSAQSITVKPSDLTKVEKLEENTTKGENLTSEDETERELLTEIEKLEITRPDPNAKPTKTFNYNTLIYVGVGIIVVIVIAILFTVLKKGNKNSKKKH